MLVLGGTGKVGSRVAARLDELGVATRIGSRAGRPPFDWNEPSTWPDAVAGVSSVFVSYHPDLAFPGAADAIGAFTELAVANGVERFVLLSGRGEPEAARSERAMTTWAPQWTVLRSSWFAQNFSEHFLLGPVLDGVIALPAGDVVEPFLDIDDLAAVAVVALTEPGHLDRVYELTGPELLSFADVANIISRTSGRSIQYMSVSASDYITAATQAGLAPDEAGAMADLFTTVLDGRNANLTTDVEVVLGRPASNFEDYARRTAATGVWTPSLMEEAS